MHILKNRWHTKGLLKLTFTILLILYLSLLAYLVFFSQYYGREYSHHSINYIPFKTIVQYLRLSGSPEIVATNIFGNIIAFVPMGFLLPIVFMKMSRFENAILVIFIATCSIELSQYVAGVGACDIDDIILNLVGGAVGYGLYFFIIAHCYRMWGCKKDNQKKLFNL